MNSITQRHYDRLASNLLYLGLIFSLGVLLVVRPRLWEEPVLSKSYMQVTLVLVHVFMAYQYFCIRRGKLWAKVLLVVWFMGSLLFFALDFQNVIRAINTPLKTANTILGYLSQALAIALAFRYKFAKS